MKKNIKISDCPYNTLCHPRVFLSGISTLLKKWLRLPITTLGNDNTARAFTLIELLVVVLIIGILSAIALPQYQKAVIKTRYAKQKALVRAIANAEEVYYLANSEYTLDVDSLDVSLPPITSSSTSTDRKYLYFSWGYCTIYVGAQNRDLFECTDNLANISYAIVFNHSGQWAGKQRCTVAQTYVIGNEICKADSGLTNPTDTQNPVYYYVW